jgi:hypothetical protein
MERSMPGLLICNALKDNKGRSRRHGETLKCLI